MENATVKYIFQRQTSALKGGIAVTDAFKKLHKFTYFGEKINFGEKFTN